MSFLLRIELPDRPGALGLVATALGTVEADIISVYVIERGQGYAIDDLIVELPPGRLADTLVTAASGVPGVRVESIRSYPAILDPGRELELIDQLVAHPDDALTRLADGVTRIFSAGWALILADPAAGPDEDKQVAEVLARSAAAPEVSELEVRWWPVPKAQALDADLAWVPGEWDNENTELAATPLNSMAILVGRPAMRWLPGELARLNHLSGIVANVL
ncbi:MAG: hypothetical protein JWM76_4505 [Pseudonocardiales bacterium]|nr:hypothetical protein [Pseudonocardiales bacterium]